MPNICSNVVTLMHDDLSLLERAATAVQKSALLQEFIKPDSDDVDAEWSKANWGCKWDVGEDDSVTEFDTENNVLELWFNSPWCPPITAYETLVDKYGFTIQAYFYELENGFCGSWEGDPDLGFDLQEFTIVGDSDWVEENIPEEINEMFSISENMSNDEDDSGC